MEQERSVERQPWNPVPRTPVKLQVRWQRWDRGLPPRSVILGLDPGGQDPSTEPQKQARSPSFFPSLHPPQTDSSRQSKKVRASQIWGSGLGRTGNQANVERRGLVFYCFIVYFPALLFIPIRPFPNACHVAVWRSAYRITAILGLAHFTRCRLVDIACRGAGPRRPALREERWW